MYKNKRRAVGTSSVKSCAVTKFVTDDVLIDVYNALTRDFQRVRNVGVIRRISSIREYRYYKHPPLSDTLDVDAYKCIYQLQNFFARYTASEDLYSDQDRREMQARKYEEDLVFINTVPQRSPAYLQPVIGRARKIIRDILGKLELQEVFDASRFGRRASIGVPYIKSYLDVKMAHTMTRSPWGASSLLNESLKGDPVLKTFLDFREKIEETTGSMESRCKTRIADTLRLSFVAKKFDKLRCVMPYPTADTYLALGIGDTLVQRLKAVGLDLSRAQAKHRRLVGPMSLHRRSVTLDLSGASDSVTRWLVRLLFPCDWWNLLKIFSFRHVKLPSGQVVHTETFAGMGCGFTFPLQTLIFYSILNAIKELLPAVGEISVYGDDCIFPTMMLPYVERVFSSLHLRINREKTFAARHFRESCGEDCYRGRSVRPFQPEGTTVEHRGSTGAAYLYKILNGLLNRWKWRDIPNTVEVLLRRIALHSGSVLLVPPYQPDTAGFKVDDPQVALDWFIPYNAPVVVYPKRAKGLPKWLSETPSWHEPVFTYKALKIRPNRRFVTWVYPYLWEKLRGLSEEQGEPTWNPYEDPNDEPSILGYAPKEHQKGVFPYVAAKGSTQFIEQTAVAGQWVTQD